MDHDPHFYERLDSDPYFNDADLQHLLMDRISYVKYPVIYTKSYFEISYFKMSFSSVSILA